MFLKRHYNWDAPKDDWELRVERCEGCEGRGAVRFKGQDIDCRNCLGKGFRETEVPPVSMVELKSLGKSRQQGFGGKFLTELMRYGVLSMDKDKIQLRVKVEGSDALVMLSYKVLQDPGRWCCFCGVKLPDEDDMATLAKAHVQMYHKGEKSPSPMNPAGYMRRHDYLTELDQLQYDKFKHLRV